MINNVNKFEAEKLCIVMPCYNEEAGLRLSAETVNLKLDELIETREISSDSCMLFSDDGSTDNTWGIIVSLHALSSSRVKGVRLAGNRGKEHALMAGVVAAKDYADVIVCMDADLQHDINVIKEFLALHREGYDIVYGIKRKRGREAFYKTLASRVFYWLMKQIGSPIEQGHTDFCLMSRTVANALAEYGETNMIFRGLLVSLGFRKKSCLFDVLDRQNGVSKFSFFKLVGLAINAVTSFSIVPLRVIGLIGCLLFVVSLFMIAWAIYDYFLTGTPSGWATLICSIWFLGGVGLIALSVMGEYLGKMFMEVKKRPRYYISDRLT